MSDADKYRIYKCVTKSHPSTGETERKEVTVVGQDNQEVKETFEAIWNEDK